MSGQPGKITCKVKDEYTLFVTVRGSKLPGHITERHLVEHFQEYNSFIVNTEIVRKKDKRFAFIKFNSAEKATAAMHSYQDSLLLNTYLLTINYGQKTVPVQPDPMPSLSPLGPCQTVTYLGLPTVTDHESQVSGSCQHSIQLGRGGLMSLPQSRSADLLVSQDKSYVLFVRVRNSKFPEDVGDSDLRSHFARFGSHIVDAFVSRNPKTNDSSGYGFVAFSSHDVAKNAMRELQGSKLLGRFSLYIRFDGLRHVQQLKHDVEKEEPLQITFERQLYLKHCFFSSPTPLSMALQKSLPVKLFLKGEFIMLRGTTSDILKATALIDANPLISNLISAAHTDTWTARFVGFLEDLFLNQTRKDVLCLLRKLPGQDDLRQEILFNVHIFSHDHAILQSTLKEIKVSKLLN